MDRTEEYVCCHEVPEVMNKNEEVFETDKLKEKPSCITDNPAFKAVCLNPWVLQVAWYHYKQQLMAQWQLKGQKTERIDMLLTEKE